MQRYPVRGFSRPEVSSLSPPITGQCGKPRRESLADQGLVKAEWKRHERSEFESKPTLPAHKPSSPKAIQDRAVIRIASI
ncbi:MAG TPA: hypothetical protein VNZ57_06760 [Longimicrobiales bacterium]|nr:hypothetical protein [Longimicrobiales bacterium]